MAPKQREFGPQWLAAQLATLLPDYPNVSLCVAFSGGVDSTALLAALASVRQGSLSHKSVRLRALHVDHGLRPASKQWASHCRAVGRRLGVPLKVLRANIVRARGESLEAAARAARYELLAAALEPGEVLVTAHHRDDQLETVLLQLFRGSGIPGLAAMPALTPFAKGWLARPLLSCSRDELEAWVRKQDLTWVDDESNAEESLDRNYLRLRVVPLIRERWPSSATAVGRSARHLAEAQTLLDSLARVDVERARYGESLSVKSLRTLSPDRRRNALRFWISCAGHLAPDTRRLEEIAGPLLDARSDASPFVEWGGARVRRDRDLLTLMVRRTVPRLSVTAPTEVEWRWRDSLLCTLPEGFGTLQLERDAHGPLDADALPDVLTVRWRGGGERLAPRRGGPRRSLKNLLREAHVPAAERSCLPLLFSHASGGVRLVAVADLLLDETVQATPTSRHRARLRWMRP